MNTLQQEQLFKELLSSYERLDEENRPTLPAFLASSYSKISSVKRAIQSLEQKKAFEVVRHKEAMDEFDKRIREIQDTCPHLHTTYHPDPSGNNDSHIECEHCGEEARRRFRNQRKRKL